MPESSISTWVLKYKIFEADYESTSSLLIPLLIFKHKCINDLNSEIPKLNLLLKIQHFLSFFSLN